MLKKTAFLLTVLLVTLKFMGLIDAAWWQIFIPLTIYISAHLLVLLLILIIQLFINKNK